MKDKRLPLLILPPLELPTNPYASVPQLAAYLRCAGFDSVSLDLNLAFHKWLLQRDIVEKYIAGGKEFAESQPHSAAREKIRTALCRIDRLGESFYAALDTDNRDGQGFRLKAVQAALSLIFAVEGEIYELDPFAQIAANADTPYSSAALLRSSAKRHSLFTPFFEEYLSAYLRGSNFLFAGISLPFAQQAENVLRIAQTIKKFAKELPVIVGGSYVGMHLSKTENEKIFTCIDALIVGQGEKPLKQTAELTSMGVKDFSNVEGAVYLKDGRICRNKEAEHIPITDIPVPVLNFDRAEYYASREDNFLRMQLSSGCGWGRCSFCNLPSCGLFPHDSGDTETSADKLDKLVSIGMRRIYFADDEADPNMLAEFAHKVTEKKIDVKWSINTRFHPSMTAEWAMLLRRAGCIRIFAGLEHFSDRMLLSVRKGTNSGMIKNCIDNIAWGGIPLTVYMMVGLPGESVEEAEISFKTLAEYLSDGRIENAIYSIFTIAPSSPIWQNPKMYGITKIHDIPGADLLPPLVNFEQNRGMTRKEAAELLGKYTHSIAQIREKRTAPHSREK